MPFSNVPGENDIEKVDPEVMKNIIDATRAAGAEHFVYTSFSRNTDISCPLRNARHPIEQHLRESGMVCTILRPGFFSEPFVPNVQRIQGIQGWS